MNFSKIIKSLSVILILIVAFLLVVINLHLNVSRARGIPVVEATGNKEFDEMKVGENGTDATGQREQSPSEIPFDDSGISINFGPSPGLRSFFYSGGQFICYYSEAYFDVTDGSGEVEIIANVGDGADKLTESFPVEKGHRYYLRVYWHEGSLGPLYLESPSAASSCLIWTVAGTVRNMYIYNSKPLIPPQVTLLTPWPNENRPGTRVVFRWEPAEHADRYQIQVRYADDNSFYRQQNLLNVTRVDLFGFPADDTRFRWRVRAGNDNGYGPWSTYRGFRNSFDAFDTNIDNTRGYQGWVTRPAINWQLNHNSMFTAGEPNRWENAHYRYLYYSDLDYSVTMKREGSGQSENYIVVRGGGRFNYFRLWHPGYRFGYTNSGNFSVSRVNANGSTTILQDWTGTGAINRGGWNTLRVVAIGNDFWFYINDTLVWSGSDSAIGQGMVGVTAFRTWGDSSMNRFYVANAKMQLPAGGDVVMNQVLNDPEQEVLNETVLESGPEESMKGYFDQ